MQGAICPLVQAAELEVREWHALWVTAQMLDTPPREGGFEVWPAPMVLAFRTCHAAMNEYHNWKQGPKEMSTAAALARLGKMTKAPLGEPRAQ